ncbi:alpha-glucosidase [Holdemania massiliensis]|uniref:alpha-glucosidase n=1 Tax=Holdemania massiliensis TaxID=1468449 RepID=UPI001F0703C3|nr:alpha-glucosidase [Holdemania massiliensis]MCH1941724.1 alpha-glucosidase [Holdemania massiliensis]
MDYKNKVIYQIWPRSFQDSNHDGIGDLRGILQRLDHLQDLGIDLIWLSPVYCSPNTDYGYDISDYYSIHPDFGTMDDFDALLAECKKRGMGIIMDLVANHTSDQHPWFQACLNDVNSPYRDCYYFREGIGNKEPNNWISMFGGSAWTKDPLKPQSWYLTTFTPHQCDLNWENPRVREEVANVMRFWLEKGVSGFRMDVINTIAKQPGLPSWHPEKKGYQFAKDLMTNLPKSHEYIQELIGKLSQDFDFITIGEGMMADNDACALYAGESRGELNMMIMFDLHLQDCGPLGKYDFRKLYHWTIPGFKSIIFRWQSDSQKRNYWVANYMNNHDQPRSISRFGNDSRYRVESAKAFALMNLTLRGTPLIYQGEEIGMTNCRLEKDEWRDYEAINIYSTLQTMMHLPKFIAKKVVQRMTRDHARTPVQWDASDYAGFSDHQPWIKVNPNYKQINLKNDLVLETSINRWYKQVIALRKAYTALNTGIMKPVLKNHKQILGYVRKDDKAEFLVLINLSGSLARFDLKTEGSILMDSYPDPQPQLLRPYESRVIQIR